MSETTENLCASDLWQRVLAHVQNLRFRFSLRDAACGSGISGAHRFSG
jgi:hypothetical protein